METLDIEYLFDALVVDTAKPTRAMKFYEDFMRTFPPLEDETPPPGINHDHKLRAHWNAYCEALAMPDNELGIITRRAMLEDYAMGPPFRVDRSMLHLHFSMNDLRRKVAKALEDFHALAATTPIAPSDSLVGSAEHVLYLQRQLDHVRSLFWREVDRLETESVCSSESMEEDVPCSGCGFGVPIGDEGQYRPGYWCSRACAFQEA